MKRVFSRDNLRYEQTALRFRGPLIRVGLQASMAGMPFSHLVQRGRLETPSELKRLYKSELNHFEFL